MSCVLTLALDDEAQVRFQLLRQRHFPPALNRIPAHLTLFHALPEDAETLGLLEARATRQRTFAMNVAEVRSLGKGVGYFLQAAEAKVLHADLARAFDRHLTAQDRQGFRPHVVVQNKVTPQTARETLDALQGEFIPWSVRAVGMDLWRYLGGPWLHLRRFAFGEDASF